LSRIRCNSPDELLQALERSAGAGYLGEPVTQLEHALQCAQLATDAGASDPEIVAALLHDLGHLCAPPDAPQMDHAGVLGHERIGAERLRAAGFAEAVAALVAGHVEAKRYLVATSAAYARRLSPASKLTLEHQGGAMSAEEVAAFERDPLRDAKLRLRSWDDQAKRPGWSVAPLAAYRELLTRQLRR
jgi:phosphonate degradation associated HDIG domain protein